MEVKLSPEPQNHEAATANLSIEGLALMHFHLEQQTWEVSFPRNGDHRLTLSIDHDGHPFAEPIELDPAVSRIEIIADGAIPPDWGQFPGGYFFSGNFSRRGDDNHEEDFRWVLDLSNLFELPLHGLVRRRSQLGPSLNSITSMTVSNVIFYTKTISFYELTLAPLGIGLFLPLGKTNNIVGADIFCEEGGGVVIKIDGEDYARLPHVPGHPYEIMLSNFEPFGQRIPADRKKDKFKRGDFRLYYDLVDVLGGYDLYCPASVLHTRDCNCEPVRASTLLPPTT